MSYVFASKNGSPENPELLANAKTLAFDIEGSGVNIGTSVPYGYSLAYEPNSAYYVHIDDQQFKNLLADESKLKIPFNAAYDRSMLKKAGVTVDNLCDPMIAAHLLGNSELSLKALALKYLGLNVVSFKELDRNIADMSMEELLGYSGPHSMAAFMLWEVLEKELRRLKLLDVFWNIEMPFVPVLSGMEFNGVAVSKDTLDALGREFDDKIAVIAEGLDYWSGHPGMNHNSPQQVAKLLYEELGVPVGRTTSTEGKPSVDKRYLETIIDRHPYIRPYLLFKQYKTLKHSYVDSLRKQIVDGRVYGSFNQTRTRTGRLSSSNPNLQKVPQRTEIGRRIRTAFVAPEGRVLVKADYDQIELRMMAHCSQDPALIEAFLAGRDIHEETAIRVFGDKRRRPEGKTMNFQCLPLYYKALTPDGWKSYGQLSEGEVILAYDSEKRVCTWTPVRKIVYYPQAFLIEIGNHDNKFACTPNHRWYGRIRQYKAGYCVKHPPREYQDAVKEAREISRGPGTSEFEIIVSAPFVGGSSPVTEDEARIVAWVHTDGSIDWSKYVGAPAQAHGKKVSARASIQQKKQPFLDEIRDLVKRENAQTGKEYVTNSGTTCIFLKPQYVRDLWAKAKLHDLTLEQFVVTLGRKPRAAFLDAMVRAEGWAKREVAQNAGSVLRAASLAFFLEGKYPRIADTSRPEYPLGRRVYGARPTITCQKFRCKLLPPGPVWCVETDYHTWVVQDSRREGDGIFITGNTIYGGGGTAQRDMFFRAYPTVEKWTKLTTANAREAGYVRTLGGRIRDIPELWSTYAKTQAHGDREAISTIVQGSSAEVVKVGMRRAWEELRGTDVRAVLAVHDEAVYEVPEKDVDDVIDILQRTLTYHDLSVPLTVSISVGKNWGTMREI